jgi:hypothetical protein
MLKTSIKDKLILRFSSACFVYFFTSILLKQWNRYHHFSYTSSKTTPRALKLPIYEVFSILKDVTMTWQYIDKNIGWCLTFVWVYILNLTRGEEMAFPWLFPEGKFGNKFERPIKIQNTKQWTLILCWRLLNVIWGFAFCCFVGLFLWTASVH